MARPIPLSAPNGTIYTYACGVCHNVEGAVTAYGMVGGPRPEIAESYREQAAKCCTCWKCGRILRRDGASRYCARCRPSEEKRMTELRAALAAQEAREQALVDASLVTALDAEAARQLREELEEISESAFVSSWDETTIQAAYRAVSGDVRGLDPKDNVGAAVLDSIRRITELARKAGGWWEWPDNQPVATFVPVEKWRGKESGVARGE